MRARRSPPPTLAEHINCLWFAQRDFRAAPFEILPDGYVELLFQFGAARTLDGAVAPDVYAIGLLDRPVTLRADGVVVTVGARLWAWGYAAIFGQPPRTAAPLALDAVHAAIGAAVPRGPDAAFDVLQSFLDARVRASPVPARVRAALRARSPRAIEHGRQLQRIFSREVGMAPKAVARRVRFECVRDALAANPRQSISALAVALGYADHAHLTREFREFAGRPPREFVANLQARSGDDGHPSLHDDRIEEREPDRGRSRGGA